jgi:hypothetical protein
VSNGAFAGRYRLEVAPELLEFIERTFVEPALPEARDGARAEALREMEGAELVLEPDGTLVSRSHGQEFLRVVLDVAALARGSVGFEKAPGVSVTLEQEDADTLLTRQAGKPPLRFRRA